MNHCPNCGNKLEPGQNYCSNCGQKPAQEKTEKVRDRKPKNKRWVKISVIIAVLIIAIAAVTIGLVIGLGSDNNNYYYPPDNIYPTYTYQPPTQTYQPTSTYTASTTHTLMADQTLSAGAHDPNPYTIQAGKTITISWSASDNVDVYIFTGANYNYWLLGSYICEASKTGSSETLSYNVVNTDTYYLVVKNTNTLGFGAAITVYSATATW